MNIETKNVLSIYRDYLSYERGTPLRVKSLLNEISKDKKIKLYTASRDTCVKFGVGHLRLSTNNISNLIELNRFIKENNIKIVIFHTISAGYYMIPLWMLNRRFKKILEMHGFSEEEGKLYGDQSFYKYHRNKFFYSCIYRLSDLITTCSQTASEKLLYFNKNTYTVLGGVDLIKFDVNLKKHNKPKLNGEGLTIGYAGNGRIWQGLPFLIDAFSALTKIDPSFNLKLLLSEKLSLPNITNVSVLEPVKHSAVAGFSASCDILVIPRPDNVVNTLSFPSKLMEYLAMGIPVVASKTSDVHRIIVHGESGMLFNPGDTQGFIECVMALKDNKLRDSIGVSGCEIARKYSWEIQSKLFTDLVKSM